MTDEPYAPITLPSLDEYSLRTTLESVQDELVKLLRERQSIDLRIYKLQTDVAHLAALCHVEVEDPIKQLGLTDAIRWILAREKKPLTIQEVVNALRESFNDVSEYKNLPANVHTILKRLLSAGQIKRSLFKGGSYIWTGGIPPLPPTPQWLKERMLKDK